MTDVSPAPAPPTKEQMIERLKSPLKMLVQNDVRGDVDTERTHSLAFARKSHLYHIGKQYLAPTWLNNEIADYTPVGAMKAPDGKQQVQAYDHVVNVLRGDARKFVAVLGQRVPVVKAMPDRQDDETNIRRARRADIEAGKLYVQWDAEAKQRTLALGVWETSTQFGFVDFVSDGARYGWMLEPKYEVVDTPLGPAAMHCLQCGADTPETDQAGACPQCGALYGPESAMPAPTSQIPQQTGTQQYPKGAVEFALADITKVITPYYVSSLGEAPWLVYEYEEHRGRLLNAFPKLRETLKGRDSQPANLMTSDQGADTRSTISSPTGTNLETRKNRLTYSRIWLRPLMYELLGDDAERKMMQENFPTGVRLTYVGDDLMDMEEDTIEAHWRACKPDVSAYLYPDPICTDFLPIQDLLNDMHNLAMETFERCIPWFLFDPQVLDPEQMRKHQLLPGEGVPAKPNVGSRLGESIWKAPTATLDTQVFQWSDQLRNVGRENTGVLPSIFGGEGPSQTAREAEMRRNQALMQLGSTWNEMRKFWSGMFECGVKLWAKYGAAQAQDDNPDSPAQALTLLSELAEDGWHFEAEEAMPMTWGQMRDFYMFLLDKNPAVWDMMGLTHPNNLPRVQQSFGMAGWTIPKLSARDKVYDTITKLLKGAPTTNPTTGEVEPSIPIDVWEDDHQFCAMVVKEWAQSEQGRAWKEAAPDGYSNVIAWGMAHLQLTIPSPAQPEGGSPVGVSPSGGPPPPGGASSPPPQGPPPSGTPVELAGNGQATPEGAPSAIPNESTRMTPEGTTPLRPLVPPPPA